MSYLDQPIPDTPFPFWKILLKFFSTLLGAALVALVINWLFEFVFHVDPIGLLRFAFQS